MATSTATTSPMITATSAPMGNARRNPKSRNGCSACKSRKLKCGEEKPECGNCLKRGNPCPGYQKTLKWSAKHEVFQPPKTRQSTDSTHEPPFATGPTARKLSSARTATTPASSARTSDEAIDERPSKRRRISSPAAVVSTSVAAETTAPKSDAPDEVIELPRSTDAPIEESPSSIASNSHSLLRTFYRLPTLTPRNAMMDTGSYLIEHYFKDVCTIFSSFDSVLNPFRMSVARIYGGSEPIYFAIQSMAAAHLANTYPQMAMIGVEMQKKASDSLQSELQLAMTGGAKPDRSLLTLLLLGLSACWHKPNDLGLKYLQTARSLMCNKLLQDRSPESKEQQRQDQFFEEALVYWEMMMGFVSPDAGKPIDDIYTSRISQPFPMPGPQESPRSANSKVLPHPWTGVAPRAQILLAETGRLVREERLQQRGGFLDLDLLASQRRYELAESLEEELLAIEPPDPEALVDVQDENTAKADFLTIAEATRCAALLDLYRIFPGLLLKRLGGSSGGETVPEAVLGDLVDPPPCSPSNFTLDDTTFPFAFVSDPIPSVPTSDPNIAFLNSLAAHILSLIETLPAISGTRFLQLMLMVMAGGELRFSDPSGINLDFFDPANEDGKVSHARAFVEQRLTEHGLRLPAKPVKRMIEIVQEVWRRSDGGQIDVFWLDVVLDRGWETVMG